MRRVRVLVLAAALLVAVSTGCGANGPAPGEPAAGTTPPTTTECVETDTRETSTTEGSTTAPDPRCPGAPSEAAEYSHPELGDGFLSIWEGTVETQFKVIHCDPSTASGTIVLGVSDDGKVDGIMDATSEPYSCSPPGGPYSVGTQTHETQISGRRTPTAFNLDFEGGRPGRLIIRGDEAKNTFSETIAGTTSSTTIVVRCTIGDCD